MLTTIYCDYTHNLSNFGSLAQRDLKPVSHDLQMSKVCVSLIGWETCRFSFHIHIFF